MHIYKYSESQIIILPQHVSVSPVIVIRVSQNEGTIGTQIVVQKLVIKQLTFTCDILKQTYGLKTIFPFLLKYNK